MRSLFIYDPNDLCASVLGGVQICTRDFLAIVRCASAAVHQFPVHVTRNPWWRLQRRIGLGSYLFYNPIEYLHALEKVFIDFQPTHVFLNRTELLRIASLVRQLSPNSKIVILSHGNQSGDDLYEASGPQGRRRRGMDHLLATWKLGSDLITESRYRHHCIDAVCVISPEEEVLERWLGSNSTILLPRLIHPSVVDWNPVHMRVGFVGTLDHTPNRIALNSIFEEISHSFTDEVEFRLVGSPPAIGASCASRYPFVRYLGRLAEDDLRAEVSTWSLFLNPVFWLSRGASMKLGQAIAWGLPTLSTRSGMRGYSLTPSQLIITPDCVSKYVSEMLALLKDNARLQALRVGMLQCSANADFTIQASADLLYSSL